MMSPAEEGPLQIGEKFLDKYLILGILGRGRHGFLYSAVNLFMRREVAIRILSRPPGLSREAFAPGQGQAAVLGRLGHKNIVGVHDAGLSESGHLYLVMELLRGMTLADWIRNEAPLEILPGLEMLEALCRGLDAGHREGAVHGDVKPANIFLTESGIPKILDFGIAELIGDAGAQKDKNRIVGTCLYMSPEQIRGQRATARSDLYALGLVMFEAFSGVHPILYGEPFGSRERRAVSWAQMKKVPRRLDELLPGFPEDVARHIHTALAKRPEQRFESAKQMEEMTRACIERYVRETGASPAKARRPGAERPRFPVGELPVRSLVTAAEAARAASRTLKVPGSGEPDLRNATPSSSSVAVARGALSRRATYVVCAGTFIGVLLATVYSVSSEEPRAPNPERVVAPVASSTATTLSPTRPEPSAQRETPPPAKPEPPESLIIAEPGTSPTKKNPRGTMAPGKKKETSERETAEPLAEDVWLQ